MELGMEKLISHLLQEAILCGVAGHRLPVAMGSFQPRVVSWRSCSSLWFFDLWKKQAEALCPQHPMLAVWLRSFPELAENKMRASKLQ